MVTIKTQELRKQIFKKGLTQASFAKEVGITQGFASLISRGKRRVSAPVAKNMTEVLKCGFDDVFEFSNDGRRNND